MKWCGRAGQGMGSFQAKQSGMMVRTQELSTFWSYFELEISHVLTLGFETSRFEAVDLESAQACCMVCPIRQVRIRMRGFDTSMPFISEG